MEDNSMFPPTDRVLIELEVLKPKLGKRLPVKVQHIKPICMEIKNKPIFWWVK
jgi:hypothetical protein